MKTRGLTRILPFLFVAFKDKIQEAFRHEKHQVENVRRMNGEFMYGGCRARNLQAIFITRRRRFKGYDRENRKCTFNKNK